MSENLGKAVRDICKACGDDRGRLMDIVRGVQEKFGQVTGKAMDVIAAQVGAHRVEVESVVTFYAFLSESPKGKFVIRVSNCVPCIEYHIPGARKVGLSDLQIMEALQIADKVRQHPARTVLETALARIEKESSGSADTAGSGCGCTGSKMAPGIGGVS